MARRVSRGTLKDRTTTHTPAVIRNRTGRPTLLTPRVEDALLHAITDGHSVRTACGNAGVSEEVFYSWMRRGRAAEQHAETLEGDDELDEVEVPFLQFVKAVYDARAQAEQRAVRAVNRQMEGGHLIAEKPLQNVQGEPVYDRDGNLLYERTWSQPDGRLAMQYLSKLSPKDWGREPIALDVQMSGSLNAGGAGPVATTEAEVVNLATRIAGVIAARQTDDDSFDDEEPSGDVVDAEILEDDDPRRESA